ncbi:MAG: hypothetical protein ACLR8Y_08140 [Alistipes indistinctus]
MSSPQCDVDNAVVRISFAMVTPQGCVVPIVGDFTAGVVWPSRATLPAAG